MPCHTEVRLQLSRAALGNEMLAWLFLLWSPVALKFNTWQLKKTDSQHARVENQLFWIPQRSQRLIIKANAMLPDIRDNTQGFAKWLFEMRQISSFFDFLISDIVDLPSLVFKVLAQLSQGLLEVLRPAETASITAVLTWTEHSPRSWVAVVDPSWEWMQSD